MLTKLILFLLPFVLIPVSGVKYNATWASLDARPLPGWYDESKFGIFCTWGVFSTFSIEAWFWFKWKGGWGTKPWPKYVEFMKKNYKPGFSYADFAPQFTAELFDPNEFAAIVKSSGAKYFVLTSKHCEGFTLWPSKYSWNWNAVDCGPHRDLVGEMRSAFLKLGDVHFGLYFAQYEWFHPLYLSDRAAHFEKDAYVTKVSYPEMIELVQNYQPDVFWSDDYGDSVDTYWKSKQFLAWLYNDGPNKDTVVVNDRWGTNAIGKHGGYMTFHDQFDPGHLVQRKWEKCMTIDKANIWSHRNSMRSYDVYTLTELVNSLARVIACNGNLLLNIGPTKDGTIIPIFEERLKQMGRWLEVNGEAVYGTRPWIHQNDSNIWYTSKMRENTVSNHVFNPQKENDTIVYAFVMKWPKGNKLILPSVTPSKKSRVRMLGLKPTVPLQIHKSGSGARIDLSTIDWTSLPSLDAWVIEMQYLASDDHDPIVHLKQKKILDQHGYPMQF